MFGAQDLTKLKKFVDARVKLKEEAEEIYQETLISAWESLSGFSGRASFSSWLCGIAKHEISDFYRKKKIKTLLFSHFPFLENLADQALGPEEKMIEAELQRKVKRVLSKVAEGYQIILRLKYIEGHSVAQIAQKLSLTLKAVESRLTRARFAFREAWIEENDQSPRKHQKDFFF